MQSHKTLIYLNYVLLLKYKKYLVVYTKIYVMITFNEIWQANQLQLKNFIATKIPEQEVPDLLQLVSIALFKNIENGTPIKNYKNWLFQVSRNKL